MGLYNPGESLLGLHRQDKAFYRQAYRSSLKSGHILREWPRAIEFDLFVVASIVPSSRECRDVLGHSVGEAKKVLVLSLAPQQYALQIKGYRFD